MTDYLIVPDDNPKYEFVVSDLREAHGTCYARGYLKFDVWSLPNKREWILPGFIYDDGARPLQFNINVKRP